MEKSLIHNTNILDTIYNSVSDGIYVIDNSFSVAFVNPILEKYSGFTKEELLDKDVSTFINHPKSKKLHQGDTLKSDVTVRGKDGSKRLAFLTITPIFEDGDLIGYIGIVVPKEDKELVSKKMEHLVDKDLYHSTQQDMAFKKQLRIIKNDLDNIRIGSSYFQTYYKPLDILSGDTYGTAYVKNGTYLLYIIDAMGKGLSASVTSIQSSGFINHAMKKARENQDLDFSRLIDSYQDFIKDRLLDNELVAAVFIYINEDENNYSIASFGMPPVIVEKDDGEIIEHMTNNMPIMNFTNEINIESHKFSDVRKLMIKSDGFEESELKEINRPYNTKIVDNFKESYLASNFIKSFEKETKTSGDDLTMVMFRRIPEAKETFSVTINNNIEDIDSILDKIESRLESYELPMDSMIEIRVTLHELIFNAVEHGNLEIDYDMKQKLMEKDDFYHEVKQIAAQEKFKDRVVKFTFCMFEDCGKKILSFSIEDEGAGFDSTNFFKHVNFDATKRLHGRGIVVANSLNNGVFYNKKGNIATFLKVLEK